MELEVYHFEGGGVAPARCTTSTTPSGTSPARRMRYGLARHCPVYLSTKNTILKAYDGALQGPVRRGLRVEFKADFEAAGLTYEHRLIDDMVAAVAEVGAAATSGLARTTTATCSPTPSRRASARSA